jgi:hypothetical protein
VRRGSPLREPKGCGHPLLGALHVSGSRDLLITGDLHASVGRAGPVWPAQCAVPMLFLFGVMGWTLPCVVSEEAVGLPFELLRLSVAGVEASTTWRSGGLRQVSGPAPRSSGLMRTGASAAG